MFLYLDHVNTCSSQSVKKRKIQSEVPPSSDFFMPRKSACQKLKQNTLKQNNLSASIDVKTYDPDTVIDNDVEIVGGYHLK